MGGTSSKADEIAANVVMIVVSILIGICALLIIIGHVIDCLFGRKNIIGTGMEVSPLLSPLEAEV